MSTATRKLLAWLTALLAADQISKLLARHWMHAGDTVELFPFFKFQLVRNRGIAFGLFDGHDTVILVVGSIIVAALVIVAVMVRGDERMAIPMAFLLAGSAGNLIDRMFMDSVTDFLRIPHWPAFNLADMFIIVGVLLLAMRLLSSESVPSHSSIAEP